MGSQGFKGVMSCFVISQRFVRKCFFPVSLLFVIDLKKKIKKKWFQNYMRTNIKKFKSPCVGIYICKLFKWYKLTN